MPDKLCPHRALEWFTERFLKWRSSTVHSRDTIPIFFKKIYGVIIAYQNQYSQVPFTKKYRKTFFRIFRKSVDMRSSIAYIINCQRETTTKGNEMIIRNEISLSNFEAWSGAVSTLDRIIEEGLCDELETIIEELYPEGIDETTLNDILWFDSEIVFEWLGIEDEDE